LIVVTGCTTERRREVGQELQIFIHLGLAECKHSSIFTDCHLCSRIRILRFFRFKKKHDFLRFFEMTYQKVVKSR